MCLKHELGDVKRRARRGGTALRATKQCRPPSSARPSLPLQLQWDLGAVLGQEAQTHRDQHSSLLRLTGGGISGLRWVQRGVTEKCL